MVWEDEAWQKVFLRMAVWTQVEPENSCHMVGHLRTGLWLKAVVCPMVCKAKESLVTSFHTDLWGNPARRVQAQ